MVFDEFYIIFCNMRMSVGNEKLCIQFSVSGNGYVCFERYGSFVILCNRYLRVPARAALEHSGTPSMQSAGYKYRRSQSPRVLFRKSVVRCLEKRLFRIDPRRRFECRNETLDV